MTYREFLKKMQDALNERGRQIALANALNEAYSIENGWDYSYSDKVVDVALSFCSYHALHNQTAFHSLSAGEYVGRLEDFARGDIHEGALFIVNQAWNIVQLVRESKDGSKPYRPNNTFVLLDEEMIAKDEFVVQFIAERLLEIASEILEDNNEV